MMQSRVDACSPRLMPSAVPVEKRNTSDAPSFGQHAACMRRLGQTDSCRGCRLPLACPEQTFFRLEGGACGMAIPLTVPTSAKAPADDNVAQLIGTLERLDTAGSVEYFDGTRRLVGDGDPVWHVRFRTEAAQSLPLNEFALGQAYVAG